MGDLRDEAHAAGPILQGAIGELFHATPDAVVVVRDGVVVASNAPAHRFFGAEGEAIAAVIDLAELLGALPDVGMTRLDLRPLGVADVLRRRVGDVDALIVRDVTTAVRHAEGLQRIAEVSRSLIGEPPSVAAVLQSLVTEAKHLTGAAYSALLLLREGSTTETSHFVYDAPRQLFPTRMPRAVGLLAVPLGAGGVARLDDIRGHPAGVGLPGVHPPIGPLLAVPVLAGEQVLGELAVANPPEGRGFDDVDQQLVQDLAAHVAVAVRWAQQAERVREQELLRQEVIDTARHDIRTPLGAGRGYAALLKSKLDKMTPEQISTAVAGLAQAFDRIESFSERLLVDPRQPLVGVHPQWQRVEVAPLLDAVGRDAVLATGRGEVVVHSEPCAPAFLAGDPEMVREVVENLLANALTHSPHGRPVVITVRGEGTQVRLDIRDEGPGIPEAAHAALSERWSRTDSSRARALARCPASAAGCPSSDDWSPRTGGRSA